MIRSLLLFVALAAAAQNNSAPRSILQGGLVIPLYAPGSHFLNSERVHEAEKYNMSPSVPGRIASIVNIHHPSIEVHTVDRGLHTGAAVILVPDGGHRTLNVGSEGADFVPFFYNYGVNTIILRSRLRSDGYNPQTGRGERCSAVHPLSPRPRQRMEHRSKQDRHDGFFSRRRTD